MKGKNRNNKILNGIVELLSQFKTDSFDENHKKELDSWIVNSTVDFDDIDNENQETRDEIWNRVSKQINQSKRANKPTLLRRTISFTISFAAIAILLVAIGMLLNIEQPTLVANANHSSEELIITSWESSIDEIKHITLEDGTKVVLNGGSNLVLVNDSYNKSLREIWLSGEAFFEVASNPQNLL